MPFITQTDRAFLDSADKAVLATEGLMPGELCYMEYKEIMRRWRESPRWTTIDAIARDLFGLSADKSAKILAFFVFMASHGMEYEAKKRAENGDI